MNPPQEVPTTLELMQARRHGEISGEEYDLLMEPERAQLGGGVLVNDELDSFNGKICESERCFAVSVGDCV